MGAGRTTAPHILARDEGTMALQFVVGTIVSLVNIMFTRW